MMSKAEQTISMLEKGFDGLMTNAAKFDLS